MCCEPTREPTASANCLHQKLFKRRGRQRESRQLHTATRPVSHESHAAADALAARRAAACAPHAHGAGDASSRPPLILFLRCGAGRWRACTHLVRERLEDVDLRVNLHLLCLAYALHVDLAPCHLDPLLLVVPLEDRLERAVAQLLIELKCEGTSAGRMANTAGESPRDRGAGLGCATASSGSCGPNYARPAPASRPTEPGQPERSGGCARSQRWGAHP